MLVKGKEKLKEKVKNAATEFNIADWEKQERKGRSFELIRFDEMDESELLPQPPKSREPIREPQEPKSKPKENYAKYKKDPGLSSSPWKSGMEVGNGRRGSPRSPRIQKKIPGKG